MRVASPLLLTPVQRWLRSGLLAANAAAPAAVLAAGLRPGWLLVLTLTLILHAFLAWALFVPACAWLGPVVRRFRPRGREVWLTIDDGPAGERSVRLAEALRRRGVRATFFVKGENLARQPQVGRALLAAGHTLGNHTHTHPAAVFWALSPGRLRRQIDGCAAALRAVAGPEEPGGPVPGAPAPSTAHLFRAPAGVKHVGLQPVLAARGMRLVAWTVRARDGVRHLDPATAVRRVLAGLTPGAIVLLHEGRAHSFETVVRVADELRRRGYACVIPSDEQLV